MDQVKRKTLEDVVECAISYSIDYSKKPANITYCSEEILKDCIAHWFSNKCNCSESDAIAYYNTALQKELARSFSEGKPSGFIVVADVVGFIAGIGNLILFLYSGFTLVFAFFAILGFILYADTSKRMKKCKRFEKAGKLWTDMINSQAFDSMEDTLNEMLCIMN